MLLLSLIQRQENLHNVPYLSQNHAGQSKLTHNASRMCVSFTKRHPPIRTGWQRLCMGRVRHAGMHLQQCKQRAHVHQRLLGLPVHGAKEVEGHGQLHGCIWGLKGWAGERGGLAVDNRLK
eukprot:1158892-Pelagomonas_calceolata.AAC.7